MTRTLTLVLLLSLTPSGRAENWPCWRGPRRDGTVTETNVPVRWGAAESVKWKVPVPSGHSSPVVWGGRIFLTACDTSTKQRLLFCLNADDGSTVWKREVLTAELEPKHKLNSYASSTPCTDGQNVWVSFQAGTTMQVACFDTDGHKVWHVSPGEFHSKHGFCSPPLLHKNLVILNGDQDAEAWIVALDKATGREVWRIDRPNRTRSYCPPIIVEAAGKTQMILSGSLCVASYDPDTGQQHWIIDGPTEQFVASPVYADGVVMITGGYPEYHLMGIKPDGTGDVTKSHVVWHHSKQASYVPSPVACNNRFFVVTDNGICHCLETVSGRVVWKERLGRHHSASPITANGLLYFPDDDGTTHVVRASDKFEVVARNKLGEGTFGSPAVSDGKIFFRTENHLWCVGP